MDERTKIMRYRWLVVLFMLLVAVPVAAQTGPSLRWARYDNIVDIESDGGVIVTEQQQIVVEQGPLRRMTRTFDLAGASIAGVEVLEDGTPYRRDTSEVPGTFSATSDGASVSIRLFFRNPNAAQHVLQLRYALQDVLVAPSATQAALDWRFFWGDNAPPIEAGSVQINLPAAVNAADLQFTADGASGQQTTSANGVRWELTAPIQGQQVSTQTTFPQTVLASNVALREPGSGVTSPNTAPNGGSGVTVPQETAPDDTVIGVPSDPSLQPGTAVGGFASLLTCMLGMVVLFVVFGMIRASARGRTVYGPTYGPTMPPMIDPDPFGMGRTRRRRRRYGGMGGGFFPPIFIPPPSQPRDNGSPWGGSPFDGGSGGGGSSWGDSGGGGSSWGSSGGGGSSWGGGGGGGSSWGGGGGGASGGSGGGGGGGSGGGSFG
jgi:hypothetical protein